MSDYTNKKWYPVLYANKWSLQLEPFYSDEDDLLDEDHYVNAKENGELAAKAPQLLQALINLLGYDCSRYREDAELLIKEFI